MASFEADELDVNIEDELQFGCEESVVKVSSWGTSSSRPFPTGIVVVLFVVWL